MPEEQRLYLRSKTDGMLIGYWPDIAGHEDLEVVTEEEAYPERHIPDHVAEAKTKAKPVNLAAGITDESGAEKEPPTDPALAKQAAKGWPK